MAQAVHEPETHDRNIAQAQDAAPDYENETAPIHYDIKEYFGAGQTFLAGLLGVIALAGGIIAGLLFANN